MCRAFVAASVPPLIICLLAAGARADRCAGPLHRADVVSCALAASLDVRRARGELKAIEARRIEAGVWLPANPVIAGQATGQVGGANLPGTPPVEWQVSLSQELELAGQRGLRRRYVDAQVTAQLRRVAAAELEVGAAALGAYFDAVAADLSLALVEDLSRTSDALAFYADERAKESLMAPIDAHVVRAEAVRVGLLRAAAQERRDVARAALAALLGRDATTIADDEMPAPGAAPDQAALVERALATRADLAAAEMERRVAERQVALLERARAPSPTVGLFTGVNVLGQQELGATVSLPIPLPAPIGRTNAGPIAEALAKSDVAQTDVERLGRRIRLEVAQAIASERARASALERFAPSLLRQARADLQALRDGIASRQLTVRDALQTQRTLIELLMADVEAHLGYARAWVQLERVTADLGAEVRR